MELTTIHQPPSTPNPETSYEKLAATRVTLLKLLHNLQLQPLNPSQSKTSWGIYLERIIHKQCIFPNADTPTIPNHKSSISHKNLPSPIMDFHDPTLKGLLEHTVDHPAVHLPNLPTTTFFHNLSSSSIESVM